MQDEKSELTGRAHIEHIRRTEYMIGMHLAPDAEAAAESMRRKLNNALKLLSEDLYSTKTHFILELIQNADDNGYAVGQKPEVHVHLSDTALTIWNNELGFSARNVSALCSVGDSTKAKKVGFIGEKGIGFKSVFQVSDSPQIHSNGFHFRFDMSNPDEHLGYVVPHWAEPEPWVQATGTTIILPAKAGESFGESVLAELDARLLLFLRNLRRIELRRPHGRASFERSDVANVVQLTIEEIVGGGPTERTEKHYVRVAHAVDMSEAQDAKRPKALDSEVVLAFPVDSEGKAVAEPHCATFAFLPIRQAGFRFHVQADFLLSSARENIQEARAWNIALRNAIAPAFVSSLAVFRGHPTLARSFLRFVPRETELVDTFFGPVVQQTLKALSSEACILGATGTWRRPDQVLIAPAAFQRLVPADDAWALFGKDYPASDLDVETFTLKNLGCAVLLFSDVVTLFTDHGDWVRTRGMAWLAEFFAYLGGLNRPNLLATNIKQTPCLLLNDGTFKAPQDGAVFYTLARGKKFGFEKELVILNEEFSEAISDQETVRSLLHDLGVRTPRPYSLINEHILPLHQGDRWRHSDFGALIGHLRYVKAMLADYLSGAVLAGVHEAAALEQLRKGLRIGTKKSEDGRWFFNRPGEMYLSSEYEPPFDIEALVGEGLDPIQLTSADYLPPKAKKVDTADRDVELKTWRDFLIQLGVNPCPRVVGEGNVSCSSELDQLLKSDDAATRRKTLECLDIHWARYEGRTTYTLSAKFSSTRYYTAFATSLRSTIAPTKQRRSVPLDGCFYATEAVRDVFGNSPTYVDAQLSSTGLLDACGIVHRVDVDACIKRLKQLKQGDKASVGAVKPIYRQLDHLFDRESAKVKEAFREHSLVFTRSDSSPWRRPDGAVWSSQGDFLNAHFPQLHGQYHDLHGFFVRKLGVPHELSVAAAVSILPLLSSSELPADARAAEAFRIYARASRELAAAQAGWQPAWLDDFKHRAVYLDHRGGMVAGSGSLYADDQPTMSALFSERAEISFLAVAPARLPQIRPLLEAANIPLLSESVKQDLQDPGSGHANAELTNRIRNRYRYIARLVYGNSHAAFERARDAGAWKRLSAMEIVDVGSLTIRAVLNEVVATTQGDVIISGTTAYARVGARGIVDRLAREICLMLKVPTSLTDSISRVIREAEEAEVEEYLEVREVPDLPEDDAAQLMLKPPESPDMDPGAEDSEPEPDDTVVAVGTAPVPASANAVLRTKTTTPAEHRDTQAPVSAATPETAQATPASSSPAPSMTGGHPPRATSTMQTPRPPSETATPEARTPPSSPQASPVMHVPLGLRPGSSSPSQRRSTAPHRGSREGGRLLSYAEPAQQESQQPDAVQIEARAMERDAIAKAAVSYFLETQKDKWTTLEEMPPLNKGFDIRAISLNGEEHFIEVKGQSAGWTEAGIAMTPSELLCAAEHRERYWLCVVEHAIQRGRQVIHLVRNPFGATDQFRFDSGWKSMASTDAATVLVPAPGVHIEMDGIGAGTIFSVKRAGGLFCRMHVFMNDGRQVFKVFDPAKMRLSTGG